MWNVLQNAPQHEPYPRFPAYFRFLTLLALYIFIKERVDVIILEVGIGGRLDSTNIVMPTVCGITHIGYDHMEILGDTLDKIAAEKSGIIKPTVPVYTIPQADIILNVFYETAKENQSKLNIVPLFNTGSPLPSLGIAGNYQYENAALAIQLAFALLLNMQDKISKASRISTTLYISDEAKNAVEMLPASLDLTQLPSKFLSGLALTKWPGRCQTITFGSAVNNNSLKFLIDGAHTDHSMECATDWFIEQYKQIVHSPDRIGIPSPLPSIPTLTNEDCCLPSPLDIEEESDFYHLSSRASNYYPILYLTAHTFAIH